MVHYPMFIRYPVHKVYMMVHTNFIVHEYLSIGMDLLSHFDVTQIDLLISVQI
ncbi:hypothetical protein ACJIZ3_015499 [Penstemon smallii]|uniref:Uncharacterized protein n=1 Tax=Penstemon smallii TaxID=265156 RepID=A0ABD3RR10_9LAMI